MTPLSQMLKYKDYCDKAPVLFGKMVIMVADFSSIWNFQESQTKPNLLGIFSHYLAGNGESITLELSPIFRVC